MNTTDLEKQDSRTIRPSQDDLSGKESWDQASKDGQFNDERPSRDMETASQERGDSDDDSDESEHPDILSRIVSRVTSRSSVAPGPPPDGGWLAWSQCIALHAVVFNTWGMVNSFGTFQSYYTTLLPERTASDISFIGTLPVFLMFFLGSFTGRMTDAGYFRQVFIIGSIFKISGVICTSFCTKYWQFILAQGLCIGTGDGCMFCPAFAIMSTYFLKKRAIAVGISACGSVTGGVIFPIMARQLLPTIGFSWTMRCLALVQLSLILLANFWMKPRINPRRAGPLIEWAAFREMEYTFYAIASFFCFWGVYFAFFYLAKFAREAIVDPFSFENSLNLLLITNGIGIIGRLVPNFLADRLGAVNLFIPVCAVASILVYCWISVESKGGLYAWSIFYGIFGGGIQSLFPAALSFLTTDLRKIGVRMGMVFTIVSFAVLTGSPIAGAIIDGTGSYKGAQAFSATSLALGCGFLLASKMVKMHKTGQGWLAKV